MKLERSKVDFPLWRKKVDNSVFAYKGTTIPSWACGMWAIPAIFSEVTSKSDPGSEVRIRFSKKNYKGWVTVATKGRKTPAYRLWYEEALSIDLKRAFVMSYMRSLENSLSSGKLADIEERIPFWEFLDIEFDKDSRLFKFVAHYTQEPSFPNLFERLIESPSIHKIDDQVSRKEGIRIYKQDWKPRGELEFELGAANVIYMLADTENKLLYIGEAKDLVKRLAQRYRAIPDWNFFRYDVLPDELEAIRVPLERMIIRAFATLLPSKKQIDSLEISEYLLANDKVDK
ncbi:MAG: GIY-YIG nuclease family protein [Desulfobulbaceae bacterium]|nr:GIY-YIG nuclease family protein [Desulfobulbaceae bacterium]